MWQHAQLQCLTQLAMVGLLGLAVTGCDTGDAHLHAYCCIMCQSLGLLLVALQTRRSLKKLKLDFTVFSWAQPSADALMALECLWRRMEELLVANGHIRFDASLVCPLYSAASCCLSALFMSALPVCMTPNVCHDITAITNSCEFPWRQHCGLPQCKDSTIIPKLHASSKSLQARDGLWSFYQASHQKITTPYSTLGGGNPGSAASHACCQPMTNDAHCCAG